MKFHPDIIELAAKACYDGETEVYRDRNLLLAAPRASYEDLPEGEYLVSQWAYRRIALAVLEAVCEPDGE